MVLRASAPNLVTPTRNFLQLLPALLNVELGAIMRSPVEWCSILGGTVLEVEMCDVRLALLLSKEVALVRRGASRSLISCTLSTVK